MKINNLAAAEWNGGEIRGRHLAVDQHVTRIRGGHLIKALATADPVEEAVGGIDLSVAAAPDDPVAAGPPSITS